MQLLCAQVGGDLNLESYKSMPVLQKITPAFTARLKVARLQALQDAPTAFGSTYAEESQLSEMDWLQRAVALNQGGSVGYLMLDDGLPCGMARGYLDEMDPQRAHVASMWVAAAYRRIGLGMRLLLSVETWATECGARELLLTVTNTNNAPLNQNLSLPRFASISDSIGFCAWPWFSLRQLEELND